MPNAASKDANPNTVIVMPESDARTLCVSLHGSVRREDYETYFLRTLKQMVDQDIPYALLINYADDYQGWQEDAAATSFEAMIDIGKYARKFAYVNAPESKVSSVKISKPLLGGEIRFFDKQELAQAVAWVKED